MKQAERHLPRQVDAYKLAQQAIALEGYLTVADLPRLAAVLSNPDQGTQLRANLVFSVDGEKRRTVQGSVKAVLPVTCQRCLESMGFKVDADLNWALVATDEEAKILPAQFDPMVVATDSGYVDLYEMLEDEVLLSLPIAAHHDDCSVNTVVKFFGDAGLDKKASARENPFAGLADLLKKEN